MEFVDHDPVAAARAAAACRDAATDLRAAASLLSDAAGPQLAAWAGDSRLTFDDAAVQLADDLRQEARRLEDSADDIDHATRRAWEADATRRQQHLDEQRRREQQRREQQQRDQCAPTGWS